MGGKTAIALGLASGLLVGGLAVGAVITLTPGDAGTVPPASAPPASAPPASAPPSEPPASGSAAPSTTPSPSAAPSASSQAEAFGVGEPAPPLELALVGGETVDLADFRGKPVWVNFIATWCPPCQDELPRKAGFLARYEETGLVILAVDVREDDATVQGFFTDLGVDLPVALDTEGAAQAAWGAAALPVRLRVDADGIVRDGAQGGIGPDLMAQGGIGPDLMAQGLQTIQPGVEVTP